MNKYAIRTQMGRMKDVKNALVFLDFNIRFLMESNEVTFWCHTTLPIDRVARIEGVVDVVESIKEKS